MIIRTYACEDCDAMFEVTHDRGDEPIPDCPRCSVVLEWRPRPFNITTHKAKSIDMAQTIMEEDYGLSNFKDNNREGDVGAIMPTENTQDREKRMQMEHEIADMASQVKTPVNEAQAQAVQAFWGGPAGQAATPNTMMAQTLLASAKAGPQAGVDAMAGLHNLGKAGKLPSNFRIIARA